MCATLCVGRWYQALKIVLLAFILAGASAALARPDAEQSYKGYLLSTPQIPHPLRPLAEVDIPPGEMEISAAVVTVADPLETHLARMFDMQIASLIRAFHARSYVLDGFAFTWEQDGGDGRDQGKHKPDEDAKSDEDGNKGTLDQRDMPSVLLFRKDLWREGKSDGNPNVRYVVLFLVGESPTFGVPPRAFRRAAACAAALNDKGAEASRLEIMDQPSPDPCSRWR